MVLCGVRPLVIKEVTNLSFHAVYKLPKWLLIVFGAYLLTTLVWRQFITDTKFIADTNTMADKTDNSAKSLFRRRCPIYAPLANFGQSDIFICVCCFGINTAVGGNIKIADACALPP